MENAQSHKARQKLIDIEGQGLQLAVFQGPRWLQKLPNALLEATNASVLGIT